jgi:hypothetical protein
MSAAETASDDGNREPGAAAAGSFHTHAAFVVGGYAERARISSIMNSPAFADRLAFAWTLAEAGLSPEQARDALAIVKMEETPPPVDAGALRQH